MRGKLQEELLHRVQEGGSERDRGVLPYPTRQGLQHRRTC